MSGQRESSARRAGRARVVAGALFAAAIAGIAAAAAWPIYRSIEFGILVVVTVSLAAVIAALAHRGRWSGWAVAGVVAGTGLVLGVPLAVPSRLGGPGEILRGLGELGAGVVLAWKDLVTVDLPVGAYRNLLVPALVVFLVGTCTLLLLAWRSDRAAYAALPVALAMVSFGPLFGATRVSAPLSVGPLTLTAPRETLLGALALLVCLLWASWRAGDERARALRRAAASSGVRVSRRTSPTDRRRRALGAGMIAGSLVLAVAVVPLAAQGAQRSVLRSAAGPTIDLSAAPSPLSQYRAMFGPDAIDDVLFRVSSSAALPERVRVATLGGYEGEVFRAGGVDGRGDGRFVRVPATRDSGPGSPFDVEIRIEELRGIWLPTAGQVSRIDFAGARAASLADGFYYSADDAAGVQTAAAGVATGDVYRVVGVEPAAGALAAAQAPGGSGERVAGDSLREWVERHATGSDGAALAGLVELLRERGYLSHGLDAEASEAWASRLEGYRFEPSASGHSLARIDAMFAQLLEREDDPRAQETGNYVAAVGDDEQFAAAVALIARELGFPSRVVVGARLQSADPDLPTCQEGACRAGDLAAWAEVRSASGEWIPVDATPQHAQSPSLELTRQRDPENVTEVRPRTADEVVPPDPVQQERAREDDEVEDAGLDLAWLGPALRAGGIVVALAALLLGPFAVIIAAKALRRRARRGAATPAARVVGGWDEYADAAVDAGRAPARMGTRSEAAASFATPAGARLASDADRAAFADPSSGPSDDEAAAFWEIVDRERRDLRVQRGFWRGVLATVSLRSLILPQAPEQGVRTSLAERGRRRATGRRTS